MGFTVSPSNGLKFNRQPMNSLTLEDLGIRVLIFR